MSIAEAFAVSLTKGYLIVLVDLIPLRGKSGILEPPMSTPVLFI